MLKTILATIVAGAFLISVPVRADDKAGAPPAGDKAKADKAEKKDKKEKKDEGKKDEKAGAGW